MSIDLDSRLSEIVNILGQVDRVVDVGCDHGYIANYLVEEKKASIVYATDISYPSLMKNKNFAKNRGNDDRVISLYGDGLEPVKDLAFDGVIIAGMGGELIIKIIREAGPILKNQVLVLQPMTASRDLRIYLSENGFYIDKEGLVRDNNKFYEVMRVRRGDGYRSTSDYYFGQNLVDVCDKTLMEYLDFLKIKTLKLIEKANLSHTTRGRSRVEELKEQVKLYEEILNECKSKKCY